MARRNGTRSSPATIEQIVENNWFKLLVRGLNVVIIPAFLIYLQHSWNTQDRLESKIDTLTGDNAKLTTQISVLDAVLKTATTDRYTVNDHRGFADLVDLRFKGLEYRLNQIERRNVK